MMRTASEVKVLKSAGAEIWCDVDLDSADKHSQLK